MQPFAAEEGEDRWVHCLFFFFFKSYFTVVLNRVYLWPVPSNPIQMCILLFLGNACVGFSIRVCFSFFGLETGCCSPLIGALCPRCSSGMRRLPFSDDEFGSPPNKMPRVNEPKKGTRRVCCCSKGRWRKALLWGLNRGGQVFAHACLCLLRSASEAPPPPHPPSIPMYSQGHVIIRGLSKHVCTHMHVNMQVYTHAWGLKRPNKCHRSLCAHIQGNKLLPFTLNPIHRHSAGFS